MQTPFNPILPANDDGLFIDEVGEWSESKYKLIGNYCNLFTKTMYSKFERLVYIDLFSGCGYSKIRNSTKMYTTFTNVSQKCSQNLHNISRERKTCSLGAPKN